MGGWKTWAAGIGQILGGASLMLAGITSDPVSVDKIAAGWAMCMLGLGTIGIGHKVEKASTTS